MGGGFCHELSKHAWWRFLCVTVAVETACLSRTFFHCCNSCYFSRGNTEKSLIERDSVLERDFGGPPPGLN